ncbi:MAG: hypothetical protein II625_07465 [Bacilli bacterium]|nr:hypothetical protein [Bacilli bacterium]
MKKILRERKDGGVSPCSASEDNIGKKKCCHIAVGAATIATVLGTSLLVYNAVKVDKSLDDVPVESNNNTTTEQLTTESAKKENVTSKQTHALTREYKHTTKKMDYIPGMPSSDYKKMKEVSTTEVAKEDTTEETTETTTEVKKPTTETTTQAPANEPSTEAPQTTEAPTTETPTEAPTTEQPTTEAPKEEPTTEATTEAPATHHHDGYCCYDCGYKTESASDMLQHSVDNNHSYGSYSWDD